MKKKCFVKYIILWGALLMGAESCSVDVPSPDLYSDPDAIASVRTGVPSGLVSIPLKYMHTPTEVVQLSDVEDVGRLLAAYVLDMEKEGSR